MAVFQNNLLAGAGAQSSGGATYSIDQSIRFNPSDSPYMQRTHGAGGNVDKWSLSFWFKRGNLGTDQYMFGSGADANNTSDINFNTSDQLTFWSYIGAYQTRLITTQVFRDPSAWYHCVVVYDSGNAVQTERARLYINGARVTSFGTETYPSQNQDGIVGSNVNIGFGRYISYGGSYFDGYLAEMNYVNGLALDPSSFGEYNSSNIWIPKEYSGSYGTGGFFVDGRDSADLGDDESGNGNDLTTSGLAAHDQVSDSPTNNFCVFSPIDKSYNSLAEGNLKTIGGTNNVGGRAVMGFKSGKWYWEMYINVYADGYPGSGVVYPTYVYGGNDYAGGATDEGAGANHGGATWFKQSASGTSYGSAASTGDVLMYALDRDNNKIYWGVNGTWRNSGDPAGGTGFVASSLTHYDDGTWMPYVCQGSNAGASSSTFNFGQDGTFAGNVTAGGNSDSNGIGNFKYSVPSGFLALCTKNLGS